MTVPLLEIEGLSKEFGSSRVLTDAYLSVRSGEVHALCGQNGSGKSTLIKILAGYHDPESGAVLRLRGREVPLPLSPDDPRRLGISFVHQDLALVPTLSIVDNIRVGNYRTGLLGAIKWKQERASVAKMLARFEVDASPDTPISALSDAERAIVGMIRALDRRGDGEPGILVLDEPTVHLPAAEVERLFAAVNRLTGDGDGVLFVSHRLEEVLDLADRVTVLRDGRVIDCREVSELDENALVRLIVGKDLGALYPEPHDRGVGGAVLEVSGLTHGDQARDVSFDVNVGEVLGLTGLLGSGFDHVPYLIAGASAPEAGTVSVNGHELRPGDPRSAVAHGVALVPADRLTLSGAGGGTVTENLTLPSLRNFTSHGVLNRRAERRHTMERIERFDVRPPRLDRNLGQLSGGNQQKLLLAKWLDTDPDVLFLHEPAQGVDVGSRKQIFATLREVADAGRAIVIASSEFEDLAHLCDRVLVFRRGEIVAEMRAPVAEEEIARRCLVDSVPSNRQTAAG